jgi:hypothetical protein
MHVRYYVYYRNIRSYFWEAIFLDKTLHKHIGRTIEIIYQASDGQITQRRIEVHAIVGGIVKGYCLHRKAARLFRIENILAVQPVHQGAMTL